MWNVLEQFYLEQLWTAASGPQEVLGTVNVLEIKNSYRSYSKEINKSVLWKKVLMPDEFMLQIISSV